MLGSESLEGLIYCGQKLVSDSTAPAMLLDYATKSAVSQREAIEFFNNMPGYRLATMHDVYRTLKFLHKMPPNTIDAKFIIDAMSSGALTSTSIYRPNEFDYVVLMKDGASTQLSLNINQREIVEIDNTRKLEKQIYNTAKGHQFLQLLFETEDAPQEMLNVLSEVPGLEITSISIGPTLTSSGIYPACIWTSNETNHIGFWGGPRKLAFGVRR